MFPDLVERLMPKLRKEDTWYRDSLEVGLNVAVPIRHLATEDNYKSLMYIFYVLHNTISSLVRDVCQAIWDEFGDESVSSPTTAEGWKEIVASYSKRWNVHHVLGALDGKHIRIRCPANGGSQFYNYKGYHSIVLLALVVANTGLRGSKMESQEQQLMSSCGMSRRCEMQSSPTPSISHNRNLCQVTTSLYRIS